MLRLLTPLLPLGLLIAVAGIGVGYVDWQNRQIDRLTTERDRLGSDLRQCAAQYKNVREDNRSDTLIDDLTDLSDFGRRWLRTEAGAPAP